MAGSHLHDQGRGTKYPVSGATNRPSLWIHTSLNNAQPTSSARVDEYVDNPTGATYADASGPSFGDKLSLATTLNDATSASRQSKRSHIQAFLQDAADEDRSSKRQHLGDRRRAHSKSEGDSTWNSGRTPVRQGHAYSYMHIEGSARAHMGDHYGDQVTINHNYLGLFAAMDMRLSQNADASEKAAIVRLAASIIFVVTLNAMVHFLLLLQCFLHYAIPKALQRRIPTLQNLIDTQAVLFEDALGRFERIDINVVVDWTSFHYNLTCAFTNQPGHRRVAALGYRLFDQGRNDQVIDPNQPPPFASIFRPNKHLRMGIHFDWSEVSLECCPKCGREQACETGKETSCENRSCDFHYRGQVDECRFEEIDKDAEREEKHDVDGQQRSVRQKILKSEQENPAWFKRISVSKQPIAPVVPTGHPANIQWNLAEDTATAGQLSPVGQSRPDQPQRVEHDVSARPRTRPWICPHPGCLREDGRLVAFVRKDDLNRHIQRHVPTRALYSCPVLGCRRIGADGLPRKDKLREHMRETHHVSYERSAYLV
jgi:hypothetical protein